MITRASFDTCVMNPPFGTRCRHHAALLGALDAVTWSLLHKTSTRAFLLNELSGARSFML